MPQFDTCRAFTETVNLQYNIEFGILLLWVLIISMLYLLS